MVLFKPPTPILIAAGGSGSGGSSIVTSDSSVNIIQNDETNQTTINMLINQEPLFVANQNKQIMVGSLENSNINNTEQFTIVADVDTHLSLKNSINNFKSVISTNVTGDIVLSSSNNKAIMPPMTEITNLKIGGIQVTSTADQINYLNTTVGTVAANKAVIADSSRNVSNLNKITCSQIDTQVITPYQPNIKQVDDFRVSQLNLNGTLLTATAEELNKVKSTPGIATASKVMIMDDNLNFYDVNEFEASKLFGSIMTPNQTNILELGTLQYLNTSGDVIIGDFLTNATNIRRLQIRDPNNAGIRFARNASTYSDIYVNNAMDLILSAGRNLLLFNDVIISTGKSLTVPTIDAANITGTLLSAEQPNITRIGTLNTLNVTTSIVTNALTSSTLTGTLQTSSQPNITSVGTLTSLSVTNGIVANSLTGTLQTANQPNITSVGTLTSLTVTNGITAASLTGVLQTTSQPNITSLGTLISLSVTNGIIANTLTGTLQTTSQPNITSIGTLSSLNVSTSINAESIIVNNLTGTLQTSAQPNITSVGTLSSLLVTNEITASTLNVSTISSNNITGILQTSSQPNITSIGTLNKLLTTGNIGVNVSDPSYPVDIFSSTASGVTAGLRIANSTVNSLLYIGSNGLIIDTSGSEISLGVNKNLRIVGGTIIGLTDLSTTNITGTLQTADQPNITSVGTLNNLRVEKLGVGMDPSNYELSIYNELGKCVNLSDNNHSFAIDIKSDKITLNSSLELLSTNMHLDLNNNDLLNVGDLFSNNITGILQTESQPNITSIGTLNNLNVGGNISSSTASISNASITNLTSTQSSLGNANATSITIGSFLVDQAYLSLLSTDPSIVDENGNINNINTLYATTIESTNIDTSNIITNDLSTTNFTATNISGTIQTSSQPNITSLGNLSNLNITGFLGVGTTSPAAKFEVSSTSSDLIGLRKGSSYSSLTINNSNDLTLTSGSGVLNMNGKMVIGPSPYGTIMPIEVGFVSFVMSNAFAYNLSSGTKGTTLAGNTTPYNYSIRTSGRILATQSVDVTSDRRVKENIEELDEEFCEKFIKNIPAVKFRWKTGEKSISYGVIAQNLLKEGYTDMVGMIPDETMQEEEDIDGTLSPAGTRFNVTYEMIIPILMRTQKKLIEENEMLKDKLDKILDMLSNEH